jgi:hypothetical protein
VLGILEMMDAFGIVRKMVGQMVLHVMVCCFVVMGKSLNFHSLDVTVSGEGWWFAWGVERKMVL